MGADRVIFGSDWPHIEGMPRPLDYAVEVKHFDDATQQQDHARQRARAHGPPTRLTRLRYSVRCSASATGCCATRRAGHHAIAFDEHQRADHARPPSRSTATRCRSRRRRHRRSAPTPRGRGRSRPARRRRRRRSRASSPAAPRCDRPAGACTRARATRRDRAPRRRTESTMRCPTASNAITTRNAASAHGSRSSWRSCSISACGTGPPGGSPLLQRLQRSVAAVRSTPGPERSPRTPGSSPPAGDQLQRLARRRR